MDKTNNGAYIKCMHVMAKVIHVNCSPLCSARVVAKSTHIACDVWKLRNLMSRKKNPALHWWSVMIMEINMNTNFTSLIMQQDQRWNMNVLQCASPYCEGVWFFFLLFKWILMSFVSLMYFIASRLKSLGLPVSAFTRWNPLS